MIDRELAVDFEACLQVSLKHLSLNDNSLQNTFSLVPKPRSLYCKLVTICSTPKNVWIELVNNMPCNEYLKTLYYVWLSSNPSIDRSVVGLTVSIVNITQVKPLCYLS